MSAERFLLRVFLAVVLSTATAFPAQSETWRESYEKALFAGKLFWKSDPVYHPETDSYFQLVRDQAGQKNRLHGRNWGEANARAREMTYKGRRGRLAVIDNADLYEWVLDQWDFTALRAGGGHTWIGLRYWCPYRELTWPDGTEHSFAAFTPWDTPWYREDGYRCSTNDIPYMGVYINPTTSRWKAAGVKKAYRHYLVEYPASSKSKSGNASHQ